MFLTTGVRLLTVHENTARYRSYAEEYKGLSKQSCINIQSFANWKSD